jgi:HlyD family secretion protein
MHRHPKFAEVKSGLAAGDEILLHPSDRVQNGARVVERTDIKK